MVQPRRKSEGAIPPPPGANTDWNVQAAYFEKYSPDELEAAGYLNPEMDADETLSVREVARKKIAERRKSTQVNLAFKQEEFHRFMALADKRHIPPATLARAWILERLDQEQGG